MDLSSIEQLIPGWWVADKRIAKSPFQPWWNPTDSDCGFVYYVPPKKGDAKLPERTTTSLLETDGSDELSVLTDLEDEEEEEGQEEFNLENPHHKAKVFMKLKNTATKPPTIQTKKRKGEDDNQTPRKRLAQRRDM